MSLCVVHVLLVPKKDRTRKMCINCQAITNKMILFQGQILSKREGMMRANLEILAKIHYMFKGLICCFEGFNQVKVVRTIGVSKGDLSTSYPCVGGVQYNLIWVIKLGQQMRQMNPITT